MHERHAFDADVAALLAHVGRTELLPRLPTARETARQKAPGEVVTAADLASERALAEGLRRIAPDAAVVGEEAAHADPALLEGIAGHERVWLVDPLDGTGHFASGRGPFGIMIALVERGVTTASWIHLPQDDATAHAHRGAGAWLDDDRLRVPAPPARGQRGGLQTRFFPDAMRERANAITDLERTDALHLCAARRYVDLARGHEHVAAYWRTLPWDHAPGVLLLQEAGGHVARFDGSTYAPADVEATGLLAAANTALWTAMHARLLGEAP